MAVHSPVNGTTAIPWKGSRRRLSLVEQLRSCEEAWCPRWEREEAHAALCGTPAGSFLVVSECVTSPPNLLLCVSAGAQHEDVLEFQIKRKGTVFHLSESQLCFSDLAQLVLFYSLTRDVLPVCLSIPNWIDSVTDTSRESLTQLEPKTWLQPQQTEEMTHQEHSKVMCSMQLTSSKGALCIINPLYLHEHGDEWLTHKATSAQNVTLQSGFRAERRLSSTRPWSGSGLQSKRAVSLDQESCAARTESSGLIRARSADSPPPVGVVLRRPSRESALSPLHRSSIDSPPSSAPSTPGSSTPELQRHGSPVPQSPHRVSWIEDGFWLPPPRPPSVLNPPSVELDSLSVSSIEEEPESAMASPTPHLTSAQRLADKMMNRLSTVGQVLGGLVSSKKRLTNRVVELSERKGGAFADAVKEFVDTTLKKGANPDEGAEFLQEVRSSLTSLRNTLFDYPEIQTLLDGITDMSDSEFDSLVERSLHKVALKPISDHLYSCIRINRTNDKTIERLQRNVHALQLNAVDELGGSAGVGVPDSVTLARIQQKWTQMHEAYSPNKKVHILLQVCKSIYNSMTANASSGKVFGADDFLPCLTWVLLRSDLVTLQIDTDYMMELLDPTQLQGEGGYYLTTLYAALYYISSFRARLAVRQLSREAEQSLNQWHRRRTLHCNQSRRSKHRRTIRRQTCRERDNKQDVETEEKSGNDDVNTEESQQQTECSSEALQTLKEEAEGEQRAQDAKCKNPTTDPEVVKTGGKESQQTFCSDGRVLKGKMKIGVEKS